MSNPLSRKLSNIASLTDEESQSISDLCERIEVVPAKTDIISEGDRPDYVHLVLEGWAARSKVLESGKRQFTAFLIRGDFCDLHVTILARMDHAITAVTNCKVAYIPSPELERLTLGNAKLTRALWWSTLVDEAVLREWIVNTGLRSAYEAVAHLICEMHFRSQMVGIVDGDTFDLPLTQEELGAATGHTPVHINRVLQKLRAAGLIDFRGGRLTVRDLDGLEEAAGFESEYFHIRSGSPLTS
ncbi:transcriptional regulator [Novosphingobium marinum]|uniref:CRP-like cAMP-binding protein n=1 Tax=Novosphingobium marinum TaxID=1514948 RepID=A0A7Z0BT88_9SPHN|nr:Crp/Fnr family transcriptional regulator [Novosphingobium marinum]NYH93843.1 CRP-like cAMP-binding protein [Novosphingobium marinum]GGC17690.1 transcriptional regulator [Novosphingobium marinum]